MPLLNYSKLYLCSVALEVEKAQTVHELCETLDLYILVRGICYARRGSPDLRWQT